ncbi:hypothetical protein JOQ06_002303 [Pogonophryne albipinna]|uniref:Uncharacterized protein n=1 Tax=Pogonophryne albipinna TaxID=1090488 RepID=A0AAD6B466_9TELE|nr:hypothetical protein JOQ06_002303 [Pogonophryne albipinna]
MKLDLLQSTGGRVQQMEQQMGQVRPEHSWAQCKTSAVVESFSQVLKSPQIPEGVSVPDFDKKLRPITAQEGDNAVFKAKVLCCLTR